MDNSLEKYSISELAAKFINQTSKPIFLTGKAGTGKTTFLRKIVEHTHKNTIIVAPTGIAAINAGGVTIHSQFGIPFGLFVPDSSYKIDENQQVKINTPYTMVKHLNMREQKRRLLQELELLIIDEVSMLRADLLDTIDFVLRNVRRQTHKSFGGVQVLFIGDLLQLPPVVKEEEWRVLSKYYNSIYFFDAQVLQKEKPIYIELDKIYRQSDSRFIDLLNNLRNNKVTKADVDLLNSFYKPDFDANKALNTITLTTHNQIADSKNKSALNALSGKSYYYNAKIEGEFNEYAYPVDALLELKVGAQVMFVKNDISGRQLYFNGKIGVISHLTDKDVEVDFKDGSKPFLVETYQWKNIKYELNKVTNEIDEVVIGEFNQLPIKLAWAITVHKSQGLTFEKAVLDINKAFAPGQVYVALSRLKSLDGLILTAPVQFQAISQDKVLTDYSESKPKIDEVVGLVSKETKEYLKANVLKAYDFVWLFNNIKQHADGYVMAEGKSVKQKHQQWANDLLQLIEPLKLNADKFCNQIIQIFETSSDDYLNTISERNTAAANYFLPVLKNISKKILGHINVLQNEKQVKTYLEELLELEEIVYRQIHYIDKASLLIDYISKNKDFDKKEFKLNNNQLERFELVKQSTEFVVKADEEEKPKKNRKKKDSVKPKKEKVEKPDTKQLTYNLFKEGKSLNEIATLRSMTVGTIEGHLVHYVSLGLIPITQFMSKEKHLHILSVSKDLGEEHSLTQLKEKLGDEYSYSDIKFSLATQKHIK